jgi:hypothetical protein
LRFFDILRLWLTAYPQSLGGKQLVFKEILEAADKEAVTLLVVNKELMGLSYERPADWFKYLNEKAKLGCPTPDEIAKIAEAKASRDVLVHNRGVASKTYESKAGNLARYKDGERIDIPGHYHARRRNCFARSSPTSRTPRSRKSDEPASAGCDIRPSCRGSRRGNIPRRINSGQGWRVERGSFPSIGKSCQTNQVLPAEA